MVTCTGHIGIHEGADGRTYVRSIIMSWLSKPNFLTSMGYHIFLKCPCDKKNTSFFPSDFESVFA